MDGAIWSRGHVGVLSEARCEYLPVGSPKTSVLWKVSDGLPTYPSWTGGSFVSSCFELGYNIFGFSVIGG